MDKIKTIVYCDFDGTITLQDVGFTLLEKFAHPSWLESEKKWQNGEIGSKQNLITIYGLVEATEKQLEDFISKIELDPYFEDLIKYCDDKDYELVILSDGLDYYIKPLLERISYQGEVYSNRSTFNQKDGFNLTFPYHNLECAQCGNCKRNHILKKIDEGYRTIYVGDGYSDRCPAEIVDYLWAKSHLLEHCKKNNISYYEFQHLGQVIEWLDNDYPI